MKRGLVVVVLLVATLLLASCASSRRPRSYGKRRGYRAPNCNCGKKRFIIAPRAEDCYEAGFGGGFH